MHIYMVDGRWPMADGQWSMVNGRKNVNSGISVPARQVPQDIPQ